MEINENCSLVLDDLYHYDISKCYYTILKNCGWNLINIDIEDKTNRNIYLGLIQKENPILSSYLLLETENLINEYFKINNIEKDNIIIYQRDGCILNKQIKDCNLSIPIDFRHRIIKLIISANRKTFIYMDDKENVYAKGIRNKPLDIGFYKLLFNLNFYSKRNLINGLESIRRSILSSNNIYWFVNEIEDGIYQLRLKNNKYIKLNKSTLDIVDLKDSDKEYFWINYIWPFCQSIILTYI